MTATVQSGKAKPVLPPPLTTIKHPIQFAKNKIWLLFYAVVFAYIGTLIVSALYYLIFQKIGWVNHQWHARVPWDGVRHSLRDQAEGLLGGLLGVCMVRNRYKKLKPINKFDKWEIDHGISNVKDDVRLSWKQGLATVPLVLLYSVAGYVIALGVVYGIRHGIMHNTSNSDAAAHARSLEDKAKDTAIAAWPDKLIGLSAAFFAGRRPAKGVFDDLQLYVAEQKVLSGKPLPKYWPPTWQATYNDVKTSGATEAVQHGKFTDWFIRIAALIGFVLACYGFYVLTFIAK
ncbi:MAG: hypothetical protein JWN38_369 [Candidatus Saccharibacteria bacterium]|nr:hypothetical protein [Candidatus Saccharibacteria bacterium]